MNAVEIRCICGHQKEEHKAGHCTGVKLWDKDRAVMQHLELCKCVKFAQGKEADSVAQNCLSHVVEV